VADGAADGRGRDGSMSGKDSGSAFSLPSSVRPLLVGVTGYNDARMMFWEHLPPDRAVDLFFELASALMSSDLVAEDLPRGYVQVAYLFNWEAHCQFSGWYALQNNQADLDLITACFREVGLPAEADAVAAAADAWFRSGGDHERASAAYSAVPNGLRIDVDRFGYLARYFSDNADRLFHIQDKHDG